MTMTMTMSSIRFAGTLSLIFSALVGVEGNAASSIPSSVQDLADVVQEATKLNPKLRAADDKRKNALIREFASTSSATASSSTASSSTASSSTTSRSLEDGGNGNDADDYFSSNWDYNADMSNADYGFDIGSYSLKYTGCSTVETYNADQANEGGSSSVLTSQRFATFRLCPTDSCSSNKYEGCSSNYGDYVVSLDQFLAAMVALNEDRVVGYCEYCQECAAIESFHKFYYETTSKKTIVLSTAKQTYQSWYSQNGYSDDGYGGDGAALAYYKAKKNSNSNTNYNANTNSGYNGNSNSGYNGGSSYSGGGSSGTQWSNTRSSWNSGNSGSNSWSDMGQSYSNWYGKQVVNGHYNNGAFVEEWGYFSTDGNFVSLEEDSLEWDAYLYGTYPDSWDEDWMGSTADEVQSCNYQYSASCYNQYETCMRVLENEDYMAYMEYVQSQYGNNGNSGMTTLADFLQCTQVDQDYIDQYQQYLAWQKAMASQYAQQSDGETYTECGEDDDGCESQYESNYDQNNNNNYNMELYIGPHCGEDGHTITLGVYTDSTCSTYTSKYSAKDILGVDVMKEHTGGSIDLFPTKCLSCVADASDSWYEDEEVEGYDTGISPLCSMLYQYAGKCNTNLKPGSSYSEYQMYQSETQQDNEEAVCKFIEVVRSNTYNEKGQITFGFSNIFSGNGFRSGARSMSGVHKAALWIFGIGVGVMVVTAMYLQSQLGERNISWRPRRFARGPAQGSQGFLREESGVSGARAHPTGDGVFL